MLLFDEPTISVAAPEPVLGRSLEDRLPPRDYQRDAAAEFFRAYEAGERHMLYRLATGCGKTYCAALTAEEWLRRDSMNRVLVLAYERNLVEQFRDELVEFLPDCSVGLEMSSDGAVGRVVPDITVASRQTLYLAKDDTSRLFKFDAVRYNWLIVCDECVSGDAICQTEKGPTRLDELHSCRWVLSYDGGQPTWRRITKWWDRGERQSIRVRFKSGREIECTANHPLYTARGWVETGSVRPFDTVLSVSRQEPTLLPKTSSRSASADVASKSRCDSVQSRAYSSRSIVAHTTRGRLRTTPSLRGVRHKPFSARSLATRRSCIPTTNRRLRGCHQITRSSKASGTVTRRIVCRDCRPQFGLSSVGGTVIKRPVWRRNVQRASLRSFALSTGMARNGYRLSGSTRLAISALRGGGATTGVQVAHRLAASTQRDSQSRTQCLRPDTLNGDLAIPSLWMKQAEGTTTFDSERTHCNPCSAESPHTFPDAWHTKYDTVVSVEPAGSRRVYDIEVEGTHCFFANGLLVHNCHGYKYGLKSVRHIVDWFEQNPASAWLGMTATPERGDGVSLARMFGHNCCEMKLSEAIHQGYLVPMRQKFIQVEGIDFKNLREVAGDFDDSELDKILSQREQLLAMAVPLLEKAGTRRTLVFTPGVECARQLAGTITAEIKAQGLPHGHAEYMIGDTPKDERNRIIRGHQRGDFQILVVCSLCRAGYNDPGLEAVAVFRPTKSRVMAEQMKGRGVRTLRGVLKPGMDAEERRAAIAASDKPHCLIIDMVGVSGMAEVASTAHLLASGEDDVVIDRANELLADDENDDTIEDAIGKAKSEIEAEREAAKILAEERRRKEREEFERQAKIRAEVRYHARDVGGVGDGGSYKQTGQVGDGPTEKQFWYLVKACGFSQDAAKKLSKRQASAIIGKHKNKNGEASSTGIDWSGPPTVNQRKVLERHGKPVPGTAREAGEVIKNITWSGKASV